MTIQAVFFDTDGIIMNGKPFSHELENDLGIPKQESEAVFQEIIESCLIGEKDMKKEIVPYLKKWKWNESVDDFLLYWFDSENVIDHLILSHIRELRKKKMICGLAINHEKYKTEYIIERMYFKDKFDHIFSSSSLRIRKPDPNFFAYISKELNIPKESIILWDTDEGHVNAANDFGFQAFLYEGFKPYQKKMKKILARI